MKQVPGQDHFLAYTQTTSVVSTLIRVTYLSLGVSSMNISILKAYQI